MNQEEAVYIWHRFSNKPECNFGESSLDCRGELKKVTEIRESKYPFYYFVCESHRPLVDKNRFQIEL